MYDTILFPTDGSEETAVALDHAIDLARRHGATLDVLYAVDGDGTDDPEELLERSAMPAREADVKVNTIALEGQIHEKIVDYVTDRGVDAVVMATHGRKGVDRFLRGSVTEKVLRNVDVPVLVVPIRLEE